MLAVAIHDEHPQHFAWSGFGPRQVVCLAHETIGQTMRRVPSSQRRRIWPLRWRDILHAPGEGNAWPMDAKTRAAQRAGTVEFDHAAIADHLAAGDGEAHSMAGIG